MRFDLSQYETVQERLDHFHKMYPNGRVITQLLEATPTRYIIMASIYKTDADLAPCATGLAEETVGSTPVNKTSAIENCETSAIGRALRNGGIGKNASREEMEKVERGNVKSPQLGAEEVIAQAFEVSSLDNLRVVWSAASPDALASKHSWEDEGGFTIDGTVADYLKWLANSFAKSEK